MVDQQELEPKVREALRAASDVVRAAGAESVEAIELQQDGEEAYLVAYVYWPVGDGRRRKVVGVPELRGQPLDVQARALAEQLAELRG